MNKAKLIHVLLIALLCFGQLAANIHAVGHLNTSDGEQPVRFTFIEGASISHYAAFHAAFSDDDAHRHDVASDEQYGEIDCTLYHIYLSQGSALSGSGQSVVAFLPHCADSRDVVVNLASIAIRRPQIRAPPFFS